MLLDENSLMVPILPGTSRLYPSSRFESRIGCGLIPLTGPVSLCTSGLKWNLGCMTSSPVEMDELAFGKFISTSNELEAEYLTIVSQNLIFWVSTCNQDPFQQST